MLNFTGEKVEPPERFATDLFRKAPPKPWIALHSQAHFQCSLHLTSFSLCSYSLHPHLRTHLSSVSTLSNFQFEKNGATGEIRTDPFGKSVHGKPVDSSSLRFPSFRECHSSPRSRCTQTGSPTSLLISPASPLFHFSEMKKVEPLERFELSTC